MMNQKISDALQNEAFYGLEAACQHNKDAAALAGELRDLTNKYGHLKKDEVDISVPNRMNSICSKLMVGEHAGKF